MSISFLMHVIQLCKIYVDDIFDSVNDYECAVQLIKDVDEVLACG